ncbi:hypothetical protein F5Y12DRAFT_779486 [Xylaria sp. FL1777]|nr:hypothetical protein F5Y12DRAFT_779486 [Xylaria sp. FL1777]
MRSTKVLSFIAALTGMSLSQKSDSEFCASDVSRFFSLVGSQAPTTPAAILSFIASHTEIPSIPTTLTPGATLDFVGHQSQLCALATALPSSLLPEFQTLAAGLLSVGKVYSSDLIAYVTDCFPEDEVASTTSYLDYIFTATGNICAETPTPAPGGASNGTYPTSSPTVTGALSSSTILVPTAAAARPTGALLGAAAAGGMLGAAAML